MFGFPSPILYVMISPELLTIKNLRSGRVISAVPEVAISQSAKSEIIAIGANARDVAASRPSRIVNPFGHPRSLVSDFTLAEQLLKYQVRQAMEKSFLALAPTIIMHPLGDPAGGFTQVELRAFREMAMGAGAAKVFLKLGKPLTDQEIVQIQKNGPDFPD